VFLYTKQTYKDYPDYYVTDSFLQESQRLTHANPQQDEFLWSSGSRLIDYESQNGDKLQAALFLPANYEQGQPYPTIVYIYEKLSQNLNRYFSPSARGFNKSVYTSRGYAVLMPDIVYEINDPGISAVHCVIPAVQAAVETGVVDKDKIGIHGHSWGGYQTAFLITQTNLFKAAVAGAPLTNMISMYSSIYWNSGSANQPIFESSQGRFKGNYLENLDAYARNSPVYHAKNVTTPLIILHNDKDGAVDWNQGIEYFNTLRQLKKPVVMLQYKGENHGLRKPANQKDYFIRMHEFFDHHLLGKPAPIWLEQGIPHLELEEHIKKRTEEILKKKEK
ncbi:MAG: prolyl oligopeptidase family serine peptidase, partial [Candidatus Aminicenantes bacterium]|nr:prolyl oligopeptidase family serine peptidase [Candidatus Aminicenantes bacterium]